MFVLLHKAITQLLSEIAEWPVCTNEKGGMGPHTEQTLSQDPSRHVVGVGEAGCWEQGRTLGASSQRRARSRSWSSASVSPAPSGALGKEAVEAGVALEGAAGSHVL